MKTHIKLRIFFSTIFGLIFVYLGFFVFPAIAGLPFCVLGGLSLSVTLVELDFHYNILPEVNKKDEMPRMS